MSDVQRRINEWQREAFGERQTVAGVMHHLTRELVELLEAVERKLAINKARRWGAPDDQGVIRHVEEAL